MLHPNQGEDHKMIEDIIIIKATEILNNNNNNIKIANIKENNKEIQMITKDPHGVHFARLKRTDQVIADATTLVINERKNLAELAIDAYRKLT